ncbi:MAG: YqgE/AlgH family protein [Cyclobacteriaceae bacterium]
MKEKELNYFNNQIFASPKRGDLLISDPFLPDPNFERTVVLICENNEEGSFGFVLNRPSHVRLHEVIDGMDNFPKPAYIGGPVQQDSLHFIHRGRFHLEGSTPLGDNVYWGGNFEQLKILAEDNMVSGDDAIFFIGYSGWSPGQLDRELKEKSWMVYPQANGYQVFDERPEHLWKEVLTEMGGKYKMFANYPINPRLN